MRFELRLQRTIGTHWMAIGWREQAKSFMYEKRVLSSGNDRITVAEEEAAC